MKIYNEKEKQAYRLGKVSAQEGILLAGYFILNSRCLDGEDEKLVRAYNNGYDSFFYEKEG